MNKRTKRAIRVDMREYKTNTVRQIIESTKSTKKIKKELTEGKHWMLGVKDTKGKRKAGREEIAKQATEYYKELYSSSRHGNKDDPAFTIPDPEEDEVPPIIDSEIRTAIKGLRNGKCPGEDGILNELLKMGEEDIIQALKGMFNQILKTEEIPEEWKSSTIILLHKKGPRDEINNYRPISLMSNLYKTFMKIITMRITHTLDEQQPTEQAGFRKGYSTADHLQSINQLIEKVQEFNLKVYIGFVDYQKAFDSVEHDTVWEALSNQGISKTYIRLLAKIYNGSQARVRTEREGKSFALSRGVRQGDPLSPKLFTSALEHQIRKLDWAKNHGVQIDGVNLSHLRFADDIILLARTAPKLQQMIEDLDRVSREAGLTMNQTKSKIMTNAVETPIRLNGETLEYVQDYIYLGKKISFSNSMEKEVKRRVSQAWRKFWSLKVVLLDKSQKLDLKVEVLNQCVIPVLLYGCQTWALTAKQRRTLQVCQRKMERKMLFISTKDRVRNEVIRKKTGMCEILLKADRLKWQWAGHVARMDNSRWTHRITMWDPRIGKRNVGGQRTRWADTFKRTAGAQWSRRARDRQEWKEIIRGISEV